MNLKFWAILSRVDKLFYSTSYIAAISYPIFSSTIQNVTYPISITYQFNYIFGNGPHIPRTLSHSHFIIKLILPSSQISCWVVFLLRFFQDSWVSSIFSKKRYLISYFNLSSFLSLYSLCYFSLSTLTFNTNLLSVCPKEMSRLLWDGWGILK